MSLRKSQALFAVENKNSHGDHLLGNEAQWKARGDDYVKLLIHNLASKEDALEFIEKNWGEVKRHMRSGGKQTRIRKSNNKVRNEFIYNLWMSPDDKLFTDLKDSRRDIIVARLAVQAGYTKVTPEIVRKVVQDQKKSRRV